MAEGENIISINIEDEMRGAYIDYSMSVIISRALPDVRDGLKPVHRRVLYGMAEMGLNYNRAPKKSARIVGDVMGKYHPHGDASVYDTMVRMAQPFSLRYPLVDGQGNFGSIDGDSPAAMRYTEARLQQIAGEMLGDINKNTVDFQANYDDTVQEPTVLPSGLPNLIINGTSGIAVGMATNMAPHNLNEVIDGLLAFNRNRDISVEELMEHVKGPDFPTGGLIFGLSGIHAAYSTGRGRVIVRAVAEIETNKNDREQIIVSEIPYQVNKAMMIEKTAALINDKKIEGISAIRDESDRKGIRIVYELKRDAVGEVVLNTLYKHTQLQVSFSINAIALVKGRPMVLTLPDMMGHYLDHRHEVVIRRTQYDLDQALKRLHILEGLLIALDNLDEIIKLIRGSADPEVARAELISRFGLSEIQARAILDMRLQRLTGLERDKIQTEHKEVTEVVADLRDILSNEPRRLEILEGELVALKEKYGDERRTQIMQYAHDIDIEDLIADEEMVITISHEGYVKRTHLREYKQQGRGGMGSRGVASKENDYTEHMLMATNLDYLLLFTSFGKVFWLKVYKLPEGSKNSKGRPIQNLIQIEGDDRVQAIVNVRDLTNPDFINNHFLVMCTEQGTIKKTLLEAYSRPRQNGINALTIAPGDTLLDVQLAEADSEIVMALQSGRAIRFNESAVRAMGRNATGVRGVTLASDADKVIGLVVLSKEDSSSLLVLSENGYGKRSAIDDYRITNRGGKGVKTMQLTDKTGELVNMLKVTDEEDLMIVTKKGIIIRMSVSTLRTMGRATQGVRLIRLSDKDSIGSVENVPSFMEDESAEVQEALIEGDEVEATSADVTTDEDTE